MTFHSDMRRVKYLFQIAVASWLFYSCAEYTPKPHGRYRIDMPAHSYVDALPDELPYSFKVSALAEIELSPSGGEKGWINFSYPALNAKVYCTYLPVTPSSVEEVLRETQELILRQAKDARAKLTGLPFDFPEHGVYTALYFMDGRGPSPLQFTITDSTRHFFRGSFYHNNTHNVDSLGPVELYFAGDFLTMAQTFCWKN